jgi:hypothetical protein
MMSQSTWEVITRNFINALRPLERYVSDAQSFRQFLYRLGWNAATVPPEYLALGAMVAEAAADLENLADEPEVDEVLALLEKVRSIHNGLTTLSEVPSGVPAAEASAFLGEITQRLFEILLVDYLATYANRMFSILQLLGVIDQQHFPETPSRPSFVHTKILWSEIPAILSHPDSLPERVIGWGTPELKLEKFLNLLSDFGQSVHAPVSIVQVPADLAGEYHPVGDPDQKRMRYMLKIPFFNLNIAGQSREIGIEILELPGDGSKLPGFIIQPRVPSEIGSELRVREDIRLLFRAGSNINALFGLIIRPNEFTVKYPFSDGTTLPEAGFGMGAIFTRTEPFILIGSPGDARLQLKSMQVDFDFHFTTEDPEVILKLAMQQLALVIAASDGFLRHLLGDGEKKLDFSLTVEWSNRSGIKFTGGGGFEVATHPHLSLGPVTIDDILIRLLGKVDPEPKISLEAGANIRGTLGPLTVVIQNMGIAMNMIFQDGNAGPFDMQLGFKPPNGVGLSMDSGMIKGGGFLRLDLDKGEYIGALELEFEDRLSLKAIGIINTKMPDGSNGFSLLIIITADFTPVQLGFGFTLMGVGGLLGLNRTARIDVLREGIKTNALKNILFPQDVVANINRIVSDLAQVFPPRRDHFIIGPMAKIGWGSPAIITLEAGLLLEIPEPRVVILGVLRALLPDEESELLKLQINFLGVIDFQNKFISFDASLYDSRLLAYTLTGDMAFRLSWGDHPLFILTVGGFHPAFKEVPADLQHMTRLTISLLSGQNPRITIQCYFAVTSNTVQFGAKAELYAAASGFNIYGFVGFDVLFQFDPFHFIAELYAGLALRRGTSVVMGIKLHGELSGPTPWDVRGKASISILFFDITVRFHETWGDPAGAIASEVADLLALLTAEVNDIRNWKADVPDTNNLHVTIKSIIQPANKLVVHPFGVLTFSERLLPLQIPIDKFGNQLPKDAKQFELTELRSDTTALASEPVKEQFAPAQFFELTDDMKLARPSFEPLTSGFKIAASGDLKVAPPVSKSVNYELAYLRKKRFSFSFAGIYTLARGLFKTAAKAGAVSRSSLSHLNNRISVNAPQAVHVKPIQYGIASVSDMQLHSPQLVAESYAEAASMYQQLIERQPELKDQLQILSSHEYETVQP